MLWQSKYFTQLPDGSFVLKSIVYCNECRMRKSIEDKMDDVIPICPWKVYVKIWWIFPVDIDKPFEIEVKLYRIYICNSEQISDYAICSASPAYIKIPLATGIFQYFPIDKKIGYKFFFLNDVKLFFQPWKNTFSWCFVPVANAFVTEFFYQLKIQPFISGIGFFVFWFLFGKIKLYGTLLEQLGWVGDQLWVVLVKHFKFLNGKHHVVRAALFFGWQLA